MAWCDDRMNGVGIDRGMAHPEHAAKTAGAGLRWVVVSKLVVFKTWFVYSMFCSTEQSFYYIPQTTTVNQS